MLSARVRYGRAAFMLAAVVVCACELTEVTIATPEDVIVAEVILRAGDPVQHAYLHRTTRTNVTGRVDSARVSVRNEATGATLQYVVEPDAGRCLRSGENTPGPGLDIGTCYVARNATGFVQPDGRYSLHIEVEGRVLTGRVQLPGTFQLQQPAAAACRLRPRQTLKLVWTRATGAWVYVVDARFGGLRQALRREGIDVSGNEPVELTGLSISGTDTTLVFPGEIGLFDRFDEDLHPIVLAIQNGLPGNVAVDVTIGAGDRNYVNWVRGGTFNPSGQVRVPSIHGDGAGVFGGTVYVRQAILVADTTGPPPCD